MFRGKANASTPAQRWMYKQLMNCLYGLWGLRPLETDSRVIDTEKYEELLEYGIDEPIPLSSGRYLANIDKRVWSEVEDELFQSESLGLRNLAISSAISAYSRILLNRYRLIPGNEAKYFDTDSVVLEKDLSPSMIGKALGLMKFESFVHIGIFLAPKLYYVLDLMKGLAKIKIKALKIN